MFYINFYGISLLRSDADNDDYLVITKV